MRLRRIFGYLTAFLIVLVLFLTSWAGWRQTTLASHLIRLHVVANSDTEDDQALKLRVRDTVLQECGTIFTDSADIAQAVEALSQSFPRIAAEGMKTVEREGYTYPLRVRLVYEDFPKTDYEGFSLPAGRYRALRVEIGEAAGHNWWCVVFPALCMGGVTEVSEAAMAAGLTEDDLALITGSREDYVIRFRCVELWEELLQKLGKGGRAPSDHIAIK